MKQIIATFAAIILAVGVALAGSAATAGTTVVHIKNGVIYTTSNHGSSHVSRKYKRDHGLHRSHGFSNRFAHRSHRNSFFRGDRHRTRGFHGKRHFKRSFKRHGKRRH